MQPNQIPLGRVLLIEDEDLIRELYKMELEKAGFKVDSFAKGKEGLAAAQQTVYNLLLLDIMLPDINGLEVLKQLKQTPTTHTLPVVLLTNLGQETVIKEGFELGAESYLIKASYTPDQIIQEVKNILAKRPVAATPQPA